MDTAFNEKCADEAMRRNELIDAAKEALQAMDNVIYSNGPHYCALAEAATRLEAAIKAEEGKE